MRRFLMAAGLALLISAGGFLLWAMMPAGRSLPQPSPAPAPADGARAEQHGRPVHVLVIGVDERPDDPGRSDVMLLVRVGDREVRTLSIPRDTLVTIEGHGEDKVNAAYTYGGPELAKKTVANLLGVPVERYVKVNLQGFRAMVDLIGGVPYEVERPMHYVDPQDGLVIDLKPGHQVLDGRKAEQYVRFRYDETGDDLSRIRRQQSFLRAAARHALQPSNLPKLPSLIYAAATHVETDLAVSEQLRLARNLFTAHQADAVIQEMLPGHADYLDGISYYLPDRAEMERLLGPWRPVQPDEVSGRPSS